MSTYGLGLCHWSDGHVIGRTDLHCTSEDEAKERAKQLVDGHPVELWEGPRDCDLSRNDEGLSHPRKLRRDAAAALIRDWLQIKPSAICLTGCTSISIGCG
jgi:hypothetical protein